jgi:16S rRNA (guanine527-N7)-methyltransferase
MSGLVPAVMPPALDLFGPEDLAAATSVSRETLERLKTYADLLAEWNFKHNLVSKASLGNLWRRHILDSAQLIDLIPPEAEALVDLGSGAGFPGLVLAELLKQHAPPMRVVLIEATGKKCRFLEAVAHALKLSVDIRCQRIEDTPPEPFDVITARACAPLPGLLAYAQRFWRKGTKGLFHKGQGLGSELTAANESWRIKFEQHPSRSDPTGIILEIRELHRVPRRSSRP